MKHLFSVILLAAAVVTWIVETTTRAHLVTRIEALRQNNRAILRVREDYDRLLRLEPFVGEIETLRRDAGEAVSLRREIESRDSIDRGPGPELGPATDGVERLPLAAWIAMADLKNAGRATPHAALQTALWAAARDELSTLSDALVLDAETRESARRILAGLPEPACSHASEPEGVVAQSLAHRLSAGDVQLVAEHLTGFEDAVEFLALRTADGETRCLRLQLVRRPDGWRLLVPSTAVESAGRELAGLPPLAMADPFRDAPHVPEP